MNLIDKHIVSDKSGKGVAGILEYMGGWKGIYGRVENGQ